MKKKFPISTYVELLSLAVQAFFVLGLVSFYQHFIPQFLGISVILSLFLYYFFKNEISPEFLTGLQVFAIIACNYANIPQIIMNYQTKKASWSIITAGLSCGGNIFRILTTLYFTKDRLLVSGYALGFVTNSILLAQILYYK